MHPEPEPYHPPEPEPYHPPEPEPYHYEPPTYHPPTPSYHVPTPYDPWAALDAISFDDFTANMYTRETAPVIDFHPPQVPSYHVPEPEPTYHVPEPEPHYPEPEPEEPTCECEAENDQIFDLEWEVEFLKDKVKTLMQKVSDLEDELEEAKHHYY